MLSLKISISARDFILFVGDDDLEYIMQYTGLAAVFLSDMWVLMPHGPSSIGVHSSRV